VTTIARRMSTLLLAMLLSPSFLTAQQQIRAVGSSTNRFVSAAIEAGDYVYVSGQGPHGTDGTLPSGFEAQFRQCLQNLQALLKSAGLTLDSVVYMQVYMTDLGSYAEMNRVFREYFPKTPPARAVLGVYALPDGPIEVNAIAVRNVNEKKGVYPPGFAKDDVASPGILTQDQLFISSVGGIDPATGKIPDDPAAQVDLALDRMTAVVKAAGLEMSHVVFVNPYLTADIPGRVMNERYARRFEFGNTPGRATIQVSSLPGGAHIEYTGVAVRDLQRRKAVRPKNMPPSPTASPCVFAGDILYCSAKSGFIPGPHGGVYASTAAHQVRQTMRNLLDNLEEAGMDLSEVVLTTVYLDSLADTNAFNEVYGEYFTSPMPASTTVQQIAPVADLGANKNGQYPDLEQVSLIAIRKPPH
jgi:reactive intermediate/imine deaminase